MTHHSLSSIVLSHLIVLICLFKATEGADADVLGIVRVPTILATISAVQNVTYCTPIMQFGRFCLCMKETGKRADKKREWERKRWKWEN